MIANNRSEVVCESSATRQAISLCVMRQTLPLRRSGVDTILRPRRGIFVSSNRHELSTDTSCQIGADRCRRSPRSTDASKTPINPLGTTENPTIEVRPLENPSKSLGICTHRPVSACIGQCWHFGLETRTSGAPPPIGAPCRPATPTRAHTGRTRTRIPGAGAPAGASEKIEGVS